MQRKDESRATSTNKLFCFLHLVLRNLVQLVFTKTLAGFVLSARVSSHLFSFAVWLYLL